MKKTCANGHIFEKSSDCPTCPICEKAKLYNPEFPKLSKPAAYLFKDYQNPILSAWNWSFLPLDLFVSLTGLWSMRLASSGDERWKKMALVSLVLTFSSGLMAIAFWSIRRDLDLSWWLPNLYLMLYPIYYIKKLLEDKNE